MKTKVNPLLFFVAIFILFIRLSSFSAEKWSVREVRAAGPDEERFFSRLVDLEVSKEKVFILDSQESTIAVFSFEGKRLYNIGKYGHGPGEFIHPADMSLGEDEIAVLDSEDFKVLLFSTDGSYKDGFRIGFRGHRLLRLSKDRIMVSRLPRPKEKNTFLLYFFDRQGKLQFQAEKISSTESGAYDYLLFQHWLVKVEEKAVLLKPFGSESAIFLDENGRRTKVLKPAPDYPTLLFRPPLPRIKNIQGLLWSAALSGDNFYFILPGKMDDGDLGPSNQVAVVNFDGQLKAVITFPIAIYKLAVLQNRFFVIDEAAQLRLFDLFKGESPAGDKNI